MITRQANPINDPEIIQFLDDLQRDYPFFREDFPSPIGEFKTKFLQSFEQWRKANPHSQVIGIDNWSTYVTSGTTESFTNFLLKYPERTTYVLNGEYPYHKMVGARTLRDFKELPTNAKLILSHPFSATGNTHRNLNDILYFCTERSIPVLLDCALLYVSQIPPLNIEPFTCIDWVCFSLSKSFSSGRFRAGVLYTKSVEHKIPLQVLNEWSYLNHLSLKIHIQLMLNFSSNFIFNKYRAQQLDLCGKLEVEPSDCVLFGISDNPKYDEYTRSGIINRLCLSKQYYRDQYTDV